MDEHAPTFTVFWAECSLDCGCYSGRSSSFLFSRYSLLDCLLNENAGRVMVHKRRTTTTKTCTSSSRTLQTTTTSIAKATPTKSSKCTKVLATGIPLLAAYSNGTPDGSAFLGYVAPKGSAAELSAVSILDGTTNKTYLILPNRAGTSFDFVTPEGLIFSLDNKLQVKNEPLQSCSDPPSVSPAVKRDKTVGLEERQITVGPLKGAATVAINVSNHCGRPVTGLSPSPGGGTLHLLFSCELAPYQYLGFHVPGVTPYRYARLAEPSPGHYIGYCPYPPYVDLSKQALCINGKAAVKAFCDAVSPSTPMPYKTGLDPKVACLPLVRIKKVGVILAGICEAGLIATTVFCKAITNGDVQNDLCGPPPASAVMNTLVTDLDIGYALGDQVTIKTDGPPVPVVLGPYVEDYLPCTSSTGTSIQPTSTSTSSRSSSTSSTTTSFSFTSAISSITTSTSSLSPSSTSPSPPTSTTPNPPPPSRDPSCMPQTIDGGFESGYPSNPANGFRAYSFDIGCCPRWGIDCYSSRGFAAAEGRCYAYIYPVLSVPIAAPGGPFPPEYSTNIGIFQNINIAHTCLGQTYSFSVSVRMQPGTGSTCGVQVLQMASGFRTADGAATYSLSTDGWSTVSWSFHSMDPYPESTGVEMNFFCTVIGPNGPPWIAFDGWNVT